LFNTYADVCPASPLRVSNLPFFLIFLFYSFASFRTLIQKRLAGRNQFLLPSEQIRLTTKATLMKMFCAATLSLIALTGTVLGQEKPITGGDEIQVKQLERAWEQAEAKQDVKAIASIVVDELSYTDYDGSLMNKAEYLRSVTSSDFQPDHFYDEGTTVKVFGSTAIATGTFRETGTAKGKAYTRRARYTDTWIKQNAVWQCVASQSTFIQSK
jgi:ketosteroid isomerase-like protein